MMMDDDGFFQFGTSTVPAGTGTGIGMVLVW
jgi:hypothetical protein